MAPTYVAKQTASRESPPDWLVRLNIDVATFCDMWDRKQPEFMPVGCTRIFESELPAPC